MIEVALLPFRDTLYLVEDWTMAKRHIYVISDLHLGGAPPEKMLQGETLSFQMCPPESRRRLARFIHAISRGHPSEITELVINGDFIDFLAEEKVEDERDQLTAEPRAWEAFTGDPDAAVLKFERAVQRTDAGAPQGECVFDALREFVSQGHTLTILLGNHDIELSIPRVRRALMQQLTAGRPSRVEFLYDGEAYVRGDLVIEHGNRYDGWNAIAYGALRAYRSGVSRGEPALQFQPPPGSRLVAEIMNPLKARYRFIDLLKPENEALIPVLTALEPDLVGLLPDLIPLSWKKTTTQPRPGRPPEREGYIAARDQTSRRGYEESSQAVRDTLAKDVFEDVVGDTVDLVTIEQSQRLLAQARAKWLGDRVPEWETQVAKRSSGWLQSARGLWRFFNQLTAAPQDRYIELRKALIAYQEALGLAFDLETEGPLYLKAASRLATGRRLVVFGHTHLPKRIKLASGAWYLNTGTWCPTVRLPADVYNPDIPDDHVMPALQTFVEDLANNRTDRWCQLQTTFVDVIMENGHCQGQLCELQQDGSIKHLGDPNGA